MGYSIYRIISDARVEGKLPADFALPDSEETEGVRWAPGAMDGVALYHMGIQKLDAAGKRLMAQAVKAAAEGDFEKAEDRFADLTDKFRAIHLVDELQRYLIKHAERLDMGQIYSTAVHMIIASENCECVKIGLEILELYNEPDTEMKEMIRRLGLYDEFTLYAIWNMCDWENGNEEIFQLAKAVNSWGRIHAVDKIEPETDEIRHWLLTEGTKNEVLNAYSALTCWQKSGAEALLNSDITDDEFVGLTFLIEGLLDEGPVPGISKLRDPKAVLNSFLEQAEHIHITWEVYEVIAEIRQWNEYLDEQDSVLAKNCAKMIASEACRETVSEAVKEGHAISLAEELGIPYLDDLQNCIRRDFEKNSYHCGRLMESQEHRQETMELFQKNVPLAEMTGAPKGVTAKGSEFQRFMQLDYMLACLENLPLEGLDFVRTGLQSPYSRTRNCAVQCLKKWVTETARPLMELNRGLYETVKETVQVENHEDLSETLTRLLAGATVFTDDSGGEETDDE